MTTDDLGRATVRWVGGLFVACLLLQRFAVPGLPVSLLVPIVLGGSVWGLLTGLADLHRPRTIAWLAAAGVTGTLVVLQSLLLDRTLVSATSWALFMTVWAPFTLRLVDRRISTYVSVLRVVVGANVAIAVTCLVMTFSQYAGLVYRDWLAEIVPSRWLLDGFVITYPVSYASPIYRANAWIGLEPSMISLHLGVALVAALLISARPVTIALLVAGLFAATSGSGFAILVVALVVMLATPARTVLRTYRVPTALIIAVGLVTPMGQSILARLGEGSADRSTSLRAIEPYQYLWPSWTHDFTATVLGLGPGSSQRMVEQSGVNGLLVPTPVKVFYDYGLLAGLVLGAMMVLCFLGGPSRAISATLFVSLWALQPGSTTMLVVMPLLLLVTWWSPHPGGGTLEDVVGAAHARPRPRARVPVAPPPRTGIVTGRDVRA